jgi:hypothetical protein
MIQRTDDTKAAAIFRGDHQAAATAANAVISAGIFAGHRIPTGDLVGSLCVRRSTVLSKPAIQG